MRLEPQYIKGGIPTTAPAQLTPCLLRLPPILYMTYRNPISGYSKAPRGLSVPPRVTGVFTGTTISPSPPPRQRPDRYTIRAGQNLPDKEFRYLRTVIVTAAVYWGFGSKLLRHSADTIRQISQTMILEKYSECLPATQPMISAECRITSPLNLPAPGRCQTLYVGFTPSAESCVFSKQSPGPGFCDRTRLRMSNTSPPRHPFSLSYGVNLQSSLVRVTSSALACSASPPVSVSGTGAPIPP